MQHSREKKMPCGMRSLEVRPDTALRIVFTSWNHEAKVRGPGMLENVSGAFKTKKLVLVLNTERNSSLNRSSFSKPSLTHKDLKRVTWLITSFGVSAIKLNI